MPGRPATMTSRGWSSGEPAALGLMGRAVGLRAVACQAWETSCRDPAAMLWTICSPGGAGCTQLPGPCRSDHASRRCSAPSTCCTRSHPHSRAATPSPFSPPSSSDDSETELVRGQGPNRPRLTLSTFGLLFTHLEAWVGEATLELLGSGPGAGPASHAPAHDRPAAEALLRLLQAVTPGICAELAIAQLAQVQAALTQLVASFGVRGALPSFKVPCVCWCAFLCCVHACVLSAGCRQPQHLVGVALIHTIWGNKSAQFPWLDQFPTDPLLAPRIQQTGQWQLLLIILLKALSMQRAPFLRPAFESREGISRLNAALANRLFTIEEFYAVLELVVVEETQ